MVEFEADDALATGAARCARTRVEQVVICSPDKDLAQCVRGDRVVCFDRRQQKTLDHLGVVAKFGVPPASIPDWLALVGDSADGYPGVPEWGAKSASAAARPLRPHRGHPRRRARVGRHRARRRRAGGEPARPPQRRGRSSERLATLRIDAPLPETLEDLRWQGARREELVELCRELGDEDFPNRVTLWRE